MRPTDRRIGIADHRKLAEDGNVRREDDDREVRSARRSDANAPHLVQQRPLEATIVNKEEVDHDFRMLHKDVI